MCNNLYDGHKWKYLFTRIVNAQQAKLIFLTWVCQLAKKQIANICTHSNYALGVAHSSGMLWMERGFWTLSGKYFKNIKEEADLLDIIQILKQLAIISISGHSKAATIEAKEK